jgi:cytochrome oxidase assembly protein ShyY1
MAGRRLPLVPTIMTAVALPLLIGLGVWQLQRMQWKADMLQRIERNRELPVSSIAGIPSFDDLLFRRIRVDLTCNLGRPREQAGRNIKGQSGYAVVFPCAVRGASDSLQRMQVNAGWSPRTGAAATTRPPSGVRTGTVIPVSWGTGQTLGLVLDEAEPPLVPSAPPTPDTIPNNHRSYAIQWFSFAAILVAVYAAWVRRWRKTNSGVDAPPVGR